MGTSDLSVWAWNDLFDLPPTSLVMMKYVLFLLEDFGKNPVGSVSERLKETKKNPVGFVSEIL